MGYPSQSPPGRGTFYRFGSVAVGVGDAAPQLQQLGRPFGVGLILGGEVFSKTTGRSFCYKNERGRGT
jgi:hypothetical protein